MARIKNFNISGKLGKLVAYEKNGKNYVRKAPQRKAPATEGELESRFQLELVSGFLKPITPFVRKGFRNYSWNFEGFSAAFSVNYKEALVKAGFDSYLDPSLVQVSSGDLGLPANLQMELNPDMVLQFTWNPAVNKNQGPRDRVMILAYNIEEGLVFYKLSGATRYAGHDSLSLTAAPPGKYHIYAAFAAEDKSRQSESKYMGEVMR